MNMFTVLLVFPLICAPCSCVLIDGEMSFDVQIIKDNHDRRHMFTKTGQEKRKKEEKDRHTGRKRKLFKGIYENETDQQTSSKKEIKQDDKRREEEGRHDLVTGKLIEKKRHTVDENKVNGKRPVRIYQAESAKKMMTKAVHLECVYQYPEREQLDALLSDMMNQLTRMIVSAHEYSESDVANATNMGDMGNVENTSDVGNVGNKSDVANATNMGDMGNVENTSDVGNVGNKSDVGNVGNKSTVGNMSNITDVDHSDDIITDVDDVEAGGDARRTEKRFRVVSDRSPAVFESVFKQLTLQYQQFYNTTLQNINRSTDPCEHQPEIKRIWQELLTQAQDVLRRSTLSALEQLFPRSRASGSGHEQLRTLLAEQLARTRPELLQALCEGFQLCYNDLL